jgi:hypothetical protein
MEEVSSHTFSEFCTLGLMINTESHVKTYARRVGLYSYADIQNGNKTLLLRCGPETEVEENSTIYFHHEELMVPKYYLPQKTCCDPVRNHRKTVFAGLGQMYGGTVKLFSEL